MKKVIFRFLLIFLSLSTYAQVPNCWDQLPNLTWLDRTGVFAIGDDIYICGGSNTSGTDFKEVWRYNIISKQIVQASEIPGTPYGKRNTTLAFTINGKAYVGLGNDYYDTRRDFYEYDLTMNSWKELDSIPATQSVDRVYGGYFTVANKIYVVSFEQLGGPYAIGKLYQYDVALNKWSLKSDFPGSYRDHACAFTIDDMAYFGLGSLTQGGSAKSDFYMYNTITDQWSYLPSFNGGGRTAAAAFSMGGYGYVTCGTGSNFSAYYGDLWKFDTASLIWSKINSIDITPRRYPFAIAINNKAYIGMGTYKTSPGNQSSLWEYHPDHCPLITEIKELANSEVSIFPNPVNNILTIESYQAVDITITNLLGEVILTEHVSSRIEIDVSHIPRGMYFVNNRKFVKE